MDSFSDKRGKRIFGMSDAERFHCPVRNDVSVHYDTPEAARAAYEEVVNVSK